MTTANPLQPNTSEPNSSQGEPVHTPLGVEPNSSAEPLNTSATVGSAPPVNQPDPNIGKSSSKKLVIIIAILLSLFVLVPLCIVLLAVAIIAINPAGKMDVEPTQVVEESSVVPTRNNAGSNLFTNSRNTERRSEINQMLNALSQYKILSMDQLDSLKDGTGKSLPTCPNQGKIFADSNPSPRQDEYNLRNVLVPNYLEEIPEDPLEKTAGGDTGYTVCVSGNSITISAPQAEGDEVSVTY